MFTFSLEYVENERFIAATASNAYNVRVIKWIQANVPLKVSIFYNIILFKYIG